jgi:cytochrome c-type biogenesis protein CcmH
VEAKLYQFIDLKRLFLIKIQNLDTVILNLFQDLKNIYLNFIQSIICTGSTYDKTVWGGLYMLTCLRSVLLILFFLPTFLWAESPLEKRANALYQEVRCPVCLGQSIADSEMDESQTLKTFILEKLKEGNSDHEIREKVRANFGDKILLRPPFEGHTLFLWLAPFGLFVLLALGVGWRVLRSSRLNLAH